tara:strand:- start:119 stop:1168 length:1050 start_codon:yes stop_codon:yes gene_type:complete
MLIDRYIIKEILLSFSITFVILVVIFLMYSLTTFLGEAVDGSLSGREIIVLTLLKTLIAFGVLLPLSYFLSTVIAFGRLNLNSELIAIKVGGTSSKRITLNILIGCILITTLTAGASIFCRPWAYEELYTLKDEIASKWEFKKVKPKRFYLSENEEQVIYLGKNDFLSGELEEIFIKNQRADGFEIITSPIGSMKSFITPKTHQLSLEKAEIYKIGSGDKFFVQVENLTLQINAFRTIERNQRVKKKPNMTLASSTNPTEKAELQWRLSAPISCLILTLAVLPLISISPRQSRLAKIPIAISIYAIYYIILGFSRTLVEQQVWPHLWFGPTIFLFALLIFLSLKRIGEN